MRNHVPALLESVASLITEEVEPRDVGPNCTESVQAHAELRREQGFSLPRVLREIRILSSTVCDALEDVASGRDVSHEEVRAVRHALHREFGRIGEEAAELYRETEAEERRQIAERLTNFARALEHEIRNPLQQAVVAVEELDDPHTTDDTERYRRRLGVLKEQLGRVAELLTEARRLTLVEESLAEERQIPVRQMVAEVFDELEEMAQSKGVDLRVGDLPEDVLVTVPRTRLALRNLTANAIKYSDPEEAVPYVEVRLRRSSSDEAAYALVVEDNGLGVPEELREEIFRPGVRAHPQVGSGTGLGLAIVQELLEHRGGSLSMEPANGGSRFVLSLPPALAVPAN